MQDIAAREDVLTRNSLFHATWVETGTYLGATTKFLAQTARMVFSIEPEPKLFAFAQAYFKDYTNVSILNGLSEEVLPQLLPTLSGDVCFWLDGHYTDETTHKGPQDTPILDELNCIGDNLSGFDHVVVLIDDVHLFNGQTHIYGPYPNIEKLEEWAHAAKLNWHIEHDIFVAKP